MRLLETISGPRDVKELSRDQLPELAREIRGVLIDWAGSPRWPRPAATSARTSAWWS